ncbi:hypothetical protein L1987_74779 [Smallanthus sonchifolius]|uniref:Uncharacterized protein n=1 Tax=Smallanthus sonchifolius TaxID=185202 RepID=A0ACB9A3Q3_9ASTR|nr:hypothetical protein L1987_89949 [Smallanthus sonchifolius]KAI3704555.1 hypothetical protein L1987_74779 [Smallanthus sonchifolius]
MRDDDPLPVSTPTTHASSTLISNKKETLDSNSSIFRRSRYKFWAITAILLLAFWSMFTGTVTLHLSAGNLNRLSDDFAGGSPIHDDFDVLEMEERETVVKQMWEVYTNGRRIKLPRFWQDAFVAAYEELTSDEPEVREAAVSEIAKMSFHSVDLHPPLLHSTNLRELSLRHTNENKGGLPLKQTIT